MVFRSCFRGLAPLLLMSFLQTAVAQSSQGQSVCGQAPAIVKTDFRDRSTAQLRWNIDDNKRYHLDPASRRMQEGEYSRNVIADIDWTLVRYPNHQGALSLLIKYALAGGRNYDFQSPECYFKWALDFAPDDGNVLMARAYYNWRTNKIDAAIGDYQEAIKLMPGSATANYNLGLIYFEQKQFQEAAKYAAVAYQLGYPLPALRDKLAGAGYKLPTPPAQESAAAPAQ